MLINFLTWTIRQSDRGQDRFGKQFNDTTLLASLETTKWHIYKSLTTTVTPSCTKEGEAYRLVEYLPTYKVALEKEKS